MTDQSQGTILNVDDNDASRYVTTRILQRAGFQVVEAATGEEALQLARQGPELVLLDVNLPDISGLEVCRRLKSDPSVSSMAVLHISAARIESADRSLGLESGADGYLVEPIEPRELVATIRSLIRLRRAEDAARQAAAQWEATFDAISDGVCLLNQHRQVIRWNAAMRSILAVGDDEIRDRPMEVLLKQGLSIDTKEAFGLSEDVALPLSVDVQGGDRWFHLSANAVETNTEVGPASASQEVLGTVLVVEDITVRKRMEDELRERAEQLAAIDRQKDEFLAMLGHELRNPLAPILNALSILGAAEIENPVQLRARQIIERQSGQLGRLVDDLLDVSRINHGSIELRRVTVDLATVLSNAVETTRPFLESREHTLTVSVPEEPLMVDADPVRMEQAVLNLLTNAAKYTDPGGQIWLSALARDGQAVVSVRDTGRGISPEMLPQVFNVFTQVDPPIDRAQGGLGLGLTLVNRLIALHGGTVEAHSEGPGKGSEFVIRLPLLGASPATRIAASASPQAQRNHLRVVVVEDNADARETLTDLLALWGHEAVGLADGEQAIGTILETLPDVAILDIGLPTLDGYEVAQRVRQNAAGQRIRLIALTGYGQPDDRDRADVAGFDHHLTKPVKPELLQSLLSSL